MRNFAKETIMLNRKELEMALVLIEFADANKIGLGYYYRTQKSYRRRYDMLHSLLEANLQKLGGRTKDSA
jgi:hypothetical protein